MKFDTQNEVKVKHVYEYTHDESSRVGSGDSMNMMEMGAVTHEWQSLSCLTDSTEQSAPVNFDMSNRVSVLCVRFNLLSNRYRHYRNPRACACKFCKGSIDE